MFSHVPYRYNKYFSVANSRVGRRVYSMSDGKGYSITALGASYPTSNPLRVWSYCRAGEFATYHARAYSYSNYWDLKEMRLR